MAEKGDRIRRAVGAVLLLGALGMLAAGDTVLADRLRSHPWEFAVFWLVCFASVVLAVVVALLDMAAMRRRLRQEKRELVVKTLRQIEEAEQTKRRSSSNRSTG